MCAHLHTWDTYVTMKNECLVHYGEELHWAHRTKQGGDGEMKGLPLHIALKAAFPLQERGVMARDKLLASTPPSFPVIVLRNARIPLRVKPPPILPAKHYLVDIDVSPRRC